MANNPVIPHITFSVANLSEKASKRPLAQYEARILQLLSQETKLSYDDLAGAYKAVKSRKTTDEQQELLYEFQIVPAYKNALCEILSRFWASISWNETPIVAGEKPTPLASAEQIRELYREKAFSFATVEDHTLYKNFAIKFNATQSHEKKFMLPLRLYNLFRILWRHTGSLLPQLKKNLLIAKLPSRLMNAEQINDRKDKLIMLIKAEVIPKETFRKIQSYQEFAQLWKLNKHDIKHGLTLPIIASTFLKYVWVAPQKSNFYKDIIHELLGPDETLLTKKWQFIQQLYEKKILNNSMLSHTTYPRFATNYNKWKTTEEQIPTKINELIVHLWGSIKLTTINAIIALIRWEEYKKGLQSYKKKLATLYKSWFLDTNELFQGKYETYAHKINEQNILGFYLPTSVHGLCNALTTPNTYHPSISIKHDQLLNILDQATEKILEPKATKKMTKKAA